MDRISIRLPKRDLDALNDVMEYLKKNSSKNRTIRKSDAVRWAVQKGLEKFRENSK